MRIFQFIENPVYVYVDDEKYATIFQLARQKYFPNRTKIIILDREDIWSFNLRRNISYIFSNPGYPKFYPNTINPNYSCAMHSKYEVLQKSIRDNAFSTKYFAWIDVGYFRKYLEENNPQPFKIDLPPNFVPNKVAYNEVFSPSNRTLNEIICKNAVWVGGGFFIAEFHVMLKWVEDYIFFTERFIELGLMSTDQQVIYAMNQPSIYKKIGKPRIDIQTYRGNRPEEWFYLGYLCKNIGQCLKFGNVLCSDIHFN